MTQSLTRELKISTASLHALLNLALVASQAQQALCTLSGEKGDEADRLARKLGQAIEQASPFLSLAEIEVRRS